MGWNGPPPTQRGIDMSPGMKDLEDCFDTGICFPDQTIHQILKRRRKILKIDALERDLVYLAAICWSDICGKKLDEALMEAVRQDD